MQILYMCTVYLCGGFINPIKAFFAKVTMLFLQSFYDANKKTAVAGSGFF